MRRSSGGYRLQEYVPSLGNEGETPRAKVSEPPSRSVSDPVTVETEILSLPGGVIVGDAVGGDGVSSGFEDESSCPPHEARMQQHSTSILNRRRKRVMW